MLIYETMDFSETSMDGNLLMNVKIVGVKSRNNREYPLAVLTKAQNLYESAPVYVDHSDKPRRYSERIGNITHPQVKENGLYGSLKLNPKHPMTESITWDFTNNSKNLGISHVIEADIDGNKITNITAVRSCDIVANPATVISLKESEDSAIDILTKKIEELTIKNTQIVNEIEELKKKKPVSYAPVASTEKFDLRDWTNKLLRKY